MIIIVSQIAWISQYMFLNYHIFHNYTSSTKNYGGASFERSSQCLGMLAGALAWHGGYGWRCGGHSGVAHHACHVWESAAQHSGSCNSMIKSTSYEVQKERTYVPNPDDGVGLWVVRRDVGGGVYGAHATRNQLMQYRIEIAYPKHSECRLLTLYHLLPSSSILVVRQ